MVEATNELIYRTLQQVQETLTEHTRLLEDLTRPFEKLDRIIDNPTQLVSIDVGFAGYANLRHDQVDTRKVELKAWFGTMEDMQRRVIHLEQAR